VTKHRKMLPQPLADQVSSLLIFFLTFALQLHEESDPYDFTVTPTRRSRRHLIFTFMMCAMLVIQALRFLHWGALALFAYLRSDTEETVTAKRIAAAEERAMRADVQIDARSGHWSNVHSSTSKNNVARLMKYEALVKYWRGERKAANRERLNARRAVRARQAWTGKTFGHLSRSALQMLVTGLLMFSMSQLAPTQHNSLAVPTASQQLINGPKRRVNDRWLSVTMKKLVSTHFSLAV
jgi:hypothetical protein